MMIALIALALIGDLVLLPALLLGPLGRAFLPSGKAEATTEPQPVVIDVGIPLDQETSRRFGARAG